VLLAVVDKDKCRCEIIVKSEKTILKAKRIPPVEIDDIQKNVRRKIWKEDHTEGMNSDNEMVTISQKKEEESDNMVRLGKKSETEAREHTIRNKLKEELQIMWHKVRLLQMSDRKGYQN
jgi:hypothetical protein